jgi:predicted RNase H-like nuclease (RuvC/YqgF family)
LLIHGADDPIRNEVEHLKEIVKNKNREIETLSRELRNGRKERDQIKRHADSILQESVLIKEQFGNKFSELAHENETIMVRVSTLTSELDSVR